MRRHVAAIVLVATAFTMALAPPSSASPRDTDTNTGVSSREVPLVKLDAAAQAQLDLEDAGVKALTSTNRGALTALRPLGIPPRFPQRYVIPSAAKMTIHWQRKSYTCGPASLRNMILVMNHAHGKGYVAPSEATLERWLGTTTDGTAISAIANVLNRRYSHYGSWKLYDAKGVKDYLARIRWDTYIQKQPVIQGARTVHLRYWNMKSLNHFNFVYGYDLSSSTVQIGEVWNPKELYGKTPVYGNPYGHRASSAGRAFTANDLSCPNCSDRRRMVS